MSVKRFLDTNLFVYQLDGIDERKRAIAECIIREGVDTGNACVSFQVVQECLNTVIRKAEIPLDTGAAMAYLNTVLVPLWHVMPSERLYSRGLEIQGRYGYGFYDALIIAAALEAGCTTLLSEDMHDGHELEGLRIENPFREDG